MMKSVIHKYMNTQTNIGASEFSVLESPLSLQI